MSTKNSTKANNNTANTANTATKPAKNPIEMTIQELVELKKSSKGLMIPIIEALIAEKTKVEALQTRTKSAGKREATVPTAYNILQPLFVTIRGNIGEKIVEDSVLVDIFNTTAKKLNITIDKAMAEKLVKKTIYFNSHSNIGDKKKNENKTSCDNRIIAFKAMLEQAKILLPLLDKAFCEDCIKGVADNACYK